MKWRKNAGKAGRSPADNHAQPAYTDHESLVTAQTLDPKDEYRMNFSQL